MRARVCAAELDVPPAALHAGWVRLQEAVASRGPRACFASAAAGRIGLCHGRRQVIIEMLKEGAAPEAALEAAVARLIALLTQGVDCA